MEITKTKVSHLSSWCKKNVKFEGEINPVYLIGDKMKNMRTWAGRRKKNFMYK